MFDTIVRRCRGTGLSPLSIVPVVLPAEKGKYFATSSRARERILNSRSGPRPSLALLILAKA